MLRTRLRTELVNECGASDTKALILKTGVVLDSLKRDRGRANKRY